MGRRRDTLLVFGFALGLAGLAWLVGFMTALQVNPPGPPVPEDIEAPRNFPLFGEVWALVDREFYGERPAPRAITYRAIEGLVGVLDDPYAAYLDRDEAEMAVAGFLPEVVGSVGIWVEPVREGALVVSTLPDSPGLRAGLAPGDVILAAGREALAGMERDDVLELLNGEAGTSVELIVRAPEEAPRSLELVRDAIEVPAVEVRRPEDDIAYIRISHFSPQVVEELDAAISDLASDPPSGLVIDLRDNPGGDLESLRSAAGRFVEGPVWIEVDRDGTEVPQSADTQGAPDLPTLEHVVVLVNAGTASAAEMLAASLRHSADAVLIGDPTYGKGAIQIVYPLSDQSVVRLTVSQWNTPDGEQVDGVGLTPDTIVSGAAEQLGAAISAALGAEPDAQAAGG